MQFQIRHVFRRWRHGDQQRHRLSNLRRGNDGRAGQSRGYLSPTRALYPAPPASGVQLLAVGVWVNNSGIQPRTYSAKPTPSMPNIAQPPSLTSTRCPAHPARCISANADGKLFRLFPGAMTDGHRAGGSSGDTLALGSSVSIGTVSGNFGSQYTGFEVLDVDGGAGLPITGDNTIAASGSIELAEPLPWKSLVCWPRTPASWLSPPAPRF